MKPDASQDVSVDVNGRRAWANYGIWIVLALGIVTIGYFVWVGVGGGGTAQAGLVADIVTLPFGLGASLLALRLAFRGRGARRVRVAWLLLGLAFLAFWLGDILWFLAEINQGAGSSPSWADVGYLGYYPLLLAGLLLLARGTRNQAERLKFSLDAGAVFLGGGLLVWYFVLLPAINSAGRALSDLITVAYPVGDLLLLLGVATLAVRRHWLRSPHALLALVIGLGLGFVTDLVYGYLSVHGSYESGGLVDGGYLASWVFLALAAQLEFAAARRRAPGQVVEDVTSDKTRFLPYISVAVGLAVLLYALRDNFGTTGGAAAVVAVLVTILAMVRQIVAQRESFRLREEKAARLGEERFHEALRRTQFSMDHVDDSIVWMDPEGRVLDVNESACRRWEYSREELLDMTVFDIDPGFSQAPEGWPAHWRLIKERGSVTLEREQRTKSGKMFPAEITANYMEFGGEEYNCSFSRDISELKKSEQTLRDSEERLVRAQAVAHVGNWELDLVTGDIQASAEAFRIYGLEPTSETLPLGMVQQVPLAEERLRLDAALRALVEGQAPYDEVFRIRRVDDGSTRVVHSVANMTRVEAGAPVKVVGVVQDITDRQRAEEMLRLTQFSVDHASDSVIWLSPDAAVLYVSDSACRRLGYAREDLLRMSVFDFAVGLVPETWPQRWEEIKQGRSLTFEKQFLARNGEVFPVEVSASFFAFEGQEYNCAFVRDISDRKHAEKVLQETEAQLRQSQKMEAIGQLAGGIAHDFNNLLTGITGYSDLILGSSECPAGAFRADVKEIRAAADRAAVLTRQILAFSRRQALQPEVLSLNDIVSATQRLLCRTLGADVDLVSVLSPDLGLTEVDASQLGNVLMNLALNARDAMPQGGKLTLETANAELGEEYSRAHPEIEPGSYVMLAVSDTGVGMDEDTKSRVFEPFFTTKESGKGTGLGLSTVYGTVKQSGGSIFVYSEPGKGTTFKIYLPRVGVPTKKLTAAQPASHLTGGQETILVVEDEPGVRELVKRILTGLGYVVIGAGDGDEALAFMKESGGTIDLLLTDVVLPGSLHGNELARAVAIGFPHVPVLYMSGYTRDAIVHAGRLDKGVNYIEKPFSPEKLAERVRQVLDSAVAAE